MVFSDFHSDVLSVVDSRRAKGLKQVTFVYGWLCFIGMTVDFFIGLSFYLQVVFLIAGIISFIISAVTSEENIAYGERGLVLLGASVILTISLRGEMVLGLTFFIPVVLFLGFVEDNESWRKGMLVFLGSCFLVSYYFSSNDFLLNVDSNFVFVGILDASIMSVLIFVIIRYFYRLNRLTSDLAKSAAIEAENALHKVMAASQVEEDKNKHYLAAQQKSSQAVKLLRKQRAALNAQQEGLQQFAYAASHDLKEPVRTIGSFIQIVRKRLPDGLEDRLELRDYFDMVTNNTRAMHKLLESLLGYSRATRSTLQPKKLDLLQFMGNVLRKHSDLEVMVCADVNSEAYAEQQALANLFDIILSNAKKFKSPERELVVRIEVSTIAQHTSGAQPRDNEALKTKTQIRFTDNGIGIPMEYRERVFDLFQRLHKREDYKGAGVGLALARRLLEKLNGEIWIDPLLETGTCVVVELPNYPSDLPEPE